MGVRINVTQTACSKNLAELSATIRLARLLGKEARCGDARAMLAEIYGWFTEGFDTRDLIEAQALLKELGA